MSYTRWRMDIAVKNPIPRALKVELDDIKEQLLRLQYFGVKVNKGKRFEENTDMLEEYICHHDTGKACEKPHRIELSKKRIKENRQDDTVGKLRPVVRLPYTKWCLARRKQTR